jgi:hypothetical protein
MARRTRGGSGTGRLFGQVIVSAVVIVACLVVRAVAGAPVLLVVAIAALIAGTAGMARATARLLADADLAPDDGAAKAEDAAVPRRLAVTRGRTTAAGVAAVAAGALALAIVLPHGDARATATAQATPATADQAVRDFLADAVLEDNAYAACGYLTPAAQQQITALAGAGQACRTALAATRPAFAGVASEGDLRSVRLHATVRDGAAFVRATPPSGRPAAFVLERAAPGASDAYRAPACAWRIAAGETAVLPGAAAGAGGGGG